VRTLLAAALVAAPLLALAAPADAVCDPKYRPLCISDCGGIYVDPKDLLGSIFRTCPD
jgi:hypothetical protein